MKRTKTIVADDGSTKVSVVIKIDDDHGLTRDELGCMASRLSDGVMSVLASERHLAVYMSDIRVK